MESEQNNNKEYVVVYDLCETDKGSIMKKVKSSTITNHCSWDDINNIQNNQNDDNVYYAELCKNLFVKFTQGDIKKNTEENNNNIILQNKKGLLRKQKDAFILQNNNTGLSFDTTNRVFTFNISGPHQPLCYQASLTNILNDDNASFKLLQPSFLKNLFSLMQHSYGKEIVKEYSKRLFCGTSVNKNFPSRCCVGCFSRSDVVADDDIENDHYTLPARISLEDVSLEKSYIKYNSK
ncbi:MAG: hypothetical protein IJT15_04525 [Rickettsiales bacterium]|nr:hypothetical protein [Rickettsiales bacterium]